MGRGCGDDDFRPGRFERVAGRVRRPAGRDDVINNDNLFAADGGWFDRGESAADIGESFAPRLDRGLATGVAGAAEKIFGQSKVFSTSPIHESPRDGRRLIVTALVLSGCSQRNWDHEEVLVAAAPQTHLGEIFG